MPTPMMSRVCQFCFVPIFLLLFTCSLVAQQARISTLPPPKRLKPARVVKAHNKFLNALKFIKNGKHLLTVGINELKEWNLDTGKPVRSLSLPHQVSDDAVFSRSGKLVAFTLAGGADLCVLNTVTGKEILHLKRTNRLICYSAIALSPDGSLLAASDTGAGLIFFWNVSNGRQIARVNARMDIHTIHFSPCGKILSSSGEDRVVRLWNCRKGKVVRHFTHSEQARIIESSCFAPNGKFFATTVRYSPVVYLWSLATGKLWKEIRFPTRPRTIEDLSNRRRFLRLAHVSFSPDGRKIVVGGEDKHGSFLSIWEVATGSMICHWASGEWENAWSNDGSQLATSIGRPANFSIWQLSSFYLSGQPITKQLTKQQLAKLWQNLASPEASVAFRAIEILRSFPEKSVPRAEQHLTRLRVASDQQLQRLLVGLSDDRFEIREQASQTLRNLGLQILPLAQKAIANKQTDPEARKRLKILLNMLQDPFNPERLLHLRLVEIFERIGNPVAVRLLKLLMTRKPGELATEARLALRRLSMRKLAQ